MSKPEDIPADEAAAAVDAILKPLGSALRHYMPVHKDEAIKAMQALLAERQPKPHETFSAWLNEGPALAQKAGVHVAVEVRPLSPAKQGSAA